MKAARYSLFTVFALSFIGSAIAYKHAVPGGFTVYTRYAPSTFCTVMSGTGYLVWGNGPSITYSTYPGSCYYRLPISRLE